MNRKLKFGVNLWMFHCFKHFTIPNRCWHFHQNLDRKLTSTRQNQLRQLALAHVAKVNDVGGRVYSMLQLLVSVCDRLAVWGVGCAGVCVCVAMCVVRRCMCERLPAHHLPPSATGVRCLHSDLCGVLCFDQGFRRRIVAAIMGDDNLSASELRQRYHAGGSKADSELSASQLRARHGIQSNPKGV